MRQIFQNLKTGETAIEEIPVPCAKAGNLLIQTQRSLVSLGTERMLVEFGRANLLQKALKEPARLRDIFLKVRSDGLTSTYQAVQRKLGAPIPLGYCNAGIVLQVGEGVNGYKIGDRVVSNASHAEVVSVPQNLTAPIPDGVSFDAATFAVVGSIALQGIRLSKVGFGETVAVVGLGLIGLIAAQILKSMGCNVLGIDISQEKLAICRSFGIHGFESCSAALSAAGSTGIDGVIICASSRSESLINECAAICRKRGSLILVGAIPLNLDRSQFYKKELNFQVSCSYGPGRYESDYEAHGLDLPLPWVRWTARRNFEAILQAIKDEQISVEPLITARVPIEKCHTVYQDISNSASIATIITYASAPDIAKPENRLLEVAPFKPVTGRAEFAVVGAGNYAQAALLPALTKVGSVKYVISADGKSSTQLAKQFGIPFSGTDYTEVLRDPAVRAVLIATRHDLHTTMACAALDAGKHVFVEKPLAISRSEIELLVGIAARHDCPSLMVGFNRRFSPHIQKMKQLLGDNPVSACVTATMNAGAIDPESWVHDPAIGGGRIIGEACHLIDLIGYIVNSPIIEVFMQSAGLSVDRQTDRATILLKFKNGALGSVNYFSNGHKSYSKERIEVYSDGKTLVCDNFRTLSGYGYGSRVSNTILKTAIDKGHKAQFQRYVAYITDGGPALIPRAQIFNSSLASVCAIESLLAGRPVRVELGVE